MLTIPLIYWLAGANRIVTVDLHRYLREDLVMESLTLLSALKGIFYDKYPQIIDQERWEALFSNQRPSNLHELKRLTGLTYLAPADASRLPLENESVDFHTSYTVLEHIPHHALKSIFLEAKRVLRPSGVVAHRVDYSDHFSHTDNSINNLNFLSYSDRQWHSLAGNRFMFMNRLRHADYVDLLRSLHYTIITAQSDVDSDLLHYVQQRRDSFFSRFASYSNQDLAATSGWLVASP